MAKIVNKSVPAILTNPNYPNLTIGVEDEGTRSTGNTSIEWETNTGGDFGIGFVQAYRYAKSPYNNNRQFIKLLEIFRNQLSKFHQLIDQKGEFFLEEKMKLSANLLLKLAPHKISLQLIDEGIIYYTAQINNLTIYFSHHLNAEDDEIDEFLASVYRDDQNVINTHGNMDEVILTMNKALADCSANIPQLA